MIILLFHNWKPGTKTGQGNLKGIVTRQRASTESARHKIQKCEGYSLCGSYFKARERLVSEEDTRHRERWYIEPEAVFWTDEIQHSIQKLPACGRRRCYNGLCFLCYSFYMKKLKKRLCQHFLAQPLPTIIPIGK